MNFIFSKNLIANAELKAQIKAYRERIDDAIFNALVERPDISYERLATEFCVSKFWVIRVAKERKVRRKSGTGSPAHPQARVKAVETKQ